MTKLRIGFLNVMLIAIILAIPRVALADVPQWDVSVSAFGGLAIPSKTDITETDPTIPEDITAKDVELKNSASFGGKITGWTTAPRAKNGLDLGLELDITHFSPDVKAQTVSATGSVSGVPIVGVTFNKIDVNSTIVAVNFLDRKSTR